VSAYGGLGGGGDGGGGDGGGEGGGDGGGDGGSNAHSTALVAPVCRKIGHVSSTAVTAAALSPTTS
jgi:hypothetical protein